MAAAFRIIRSSGFHLTFSNGLTVSVQFGPGNYGSNYDMMFDGDDQKVPEAYTAEVAVWNEKGRWITRQFFPDCDGDDTVVGYVTPDRVADLITDVKNAPREVTQ